MDLSHQPGHRLLVVRSGKAEDDVVVASLDERRQQLGNLLWRAGRLGRGWPSGPRFGVAVVLVDALEHVQRLLLRVTNEDWSDVDRALDLALVTADLLAVPAESSFLALERLYAVGIADVARVGVARHESQRDV